MIDRMERIRKMIRNEISVIIQSEVNNPKISGVTITNVEVSRDLREAKVLCQIDGDDERKKTVLKALKSAAGFIRGELGHRVEIKFVPRIVFMEDKAAERKQEMDSLFEKIEKEHHWESEEPNGRIE